MKGVLFGPFGKLPCASRYALGVNEALWEFRRLPDGTIILADEKNVFERKIRG